MKGRALGAAFVAALFSALTGSLAWADNPHGTAPGQAAKDSTSVTASSAAADNPGQAKKADESSSNSASASASVSASANASASTGSSSSRDAQTKQTPGG